MKIFMLGWEFPPFISGGLGTACYGLTKAMDKLGIKVSFVLPKMVSSQYTSHVKLLSSDTYNKTTTFTSEEFENVKFHSIPSALKPYSSPEACHHQTEINLKKECQIFGKKSSAMNLSTQVGQYAGDMLTEVHRYASIATDLASNEDFDLVYYLL